MSPLLDSRERPIRQPKRARHGLSRNQIVLLVAAAIGAAAALGAGFLTVATSIWQTKATRVAYSGPWLRFEYFICTGPYNNGTTTFQQLPVHALENTTSIDFERAPRDFVIKNAVFENIRLLEPEGDPSYDRRGPVTNVRMNERELDALTGFAESGDVGMWEMREHVRDKEEIKRKVAHYFEFFRANRPTISMMASIGRIPPWVRAILRSDPLYDEPIDFAIVPGPHNDAIYGYAYFRSVRTVHVRVQNVSHYVLTNLELHLAKLGAGDQIAMKPTGNVTEAERARFPLNILRPHETVVYPLSISLIPHLEATSMFPGAAEYLKERWSQDQLEDTQATLVSTVGQQEVHLRPSFELERVTFHVEDESAVLKESRGIATRDRLHVSKSCECGSCPLVKVRRRDGSWIRTREILTYADARHRTEQFDIGVADGIHEFMIAENPGETAFIRNLTVDMELPGGRKVSHQLEPGEVIVTFEKPYIIDLKPYRCSGGNLRIRGKGYYLMYADVICPFVFPLPSRWVQTVAGADRQRRAAGNGLGGEDGDQLHPDNRRSTEVAQLLAPVGGERRRSQ